MQTPKDFHSYAQHGEDSAILNLLSAGAARWFVDVGANDGCSWSNSYAFGLLGFDLLLIEPMAAYAQRCRELWADNPRVRVEQKVISEKNGVVDFFVNEDAETDLLAMRSSVRAEIIPSDTLTRTSVDSVPLTSLLDRHGVPRRFAALSIDAEGVDLQVLRSLDFTRYRPDVICVEDETDLANISGFLLSAGYTEVSRLGPNGLYVPAPRFSDRLRGWLKRGGAR